MRPPWVVSSRRAKNAGATAKPPSSCFMASNSSALIVPPAAPPGTNDILGIRPPEKIAHELLWLWIGLGILVLAGLAFLAWSRWWRHRFARPPTPPIPAHVRAKERLHRALSLISEPRLFCIEVSDALRTYLEERFNFKAPERTTEEFLDELKATDLLLPDQKLSLVDFLQRCDLVKFARHEPPEVELREIYEAALRLIDETQYEPAEATGVAVK